MAEGALWDLTVGLDVAPEAPPFAGESLGVRQGLSGPSRAGKQTPDLLPGR